MGAATTVSRRSESALGTSLVSVSSSPTRRGFLTGASAAACLALQGSCSWRAGSPRRAQGQPGVGFLRQTDAAPLLLAEDLGAYAKHGLAPTLQRGGSPMELGERLLSGELCVAQLPASTPLRRALAAPREPRLVTLMVLSHNGAAVTLGRELCGGVGFLDLTGLRQALAKRAPAEPAVFAVPAIGGADDLMLRYLLAAAGLSPSRFEVVSAPAERMLADLREERIIGFAAPDPWSALAAAQDVGFTFATAQDIWRRAPRSVLATTASTLAQRHSQIKSLIRCIVEASVWLDVPGNRARATIGEALARRQNLDLDAAPIRARLGSVYDLGCRMGERDFEDDMLFFHRAGRVNLPLRADAYLYAALLARFGLVSATPAQADGGADASAVASTISDQLYREVAQEIGLPLPDDMKPFVITLDAVRFDPGAPSEWARLWPRR